MRSWGRSVGLLLGLGSAVAIAAPPPNDFQRLQVALERAGVMVKLALPPVSGVYGLFRSGDRTIWINPVVFDLGIAEATLVHEGTHAVQACRGRGGQLTVLGLTYRAPAQARRLYQRYPTQPWREALEEEAYAVQSRPDRVEELLRLLNRHCRR